MCLGGSKGAKKSAAAQAAANAALVAQVQQQSEANRLSAEKQAADALAAAKAQTDALNAQIAAQSAAQSEQARQSAESIQAMQASLLEGQRSAAQAAEMAIKNTGQKAKAPNIANLMKANKAANSRGISSTMLTGPQGVNPAALTLGRNQLLGV